MFRIIDIQTNNTLGLSTEKFVNLEEKQLYETKFRTKLKEVLSISTLLNFNGYMLSLKENGLL